MKSMKKNTDGVDDAKIKNCPSKDDTKETTEWEKMSKAYLPGQHGYIVNKIVKLRVNEAYSESVYVRSKTDQADQQCMVMYELTSNVC